MSCAAVGHRIVEAEDVNLSLVNEEPRHGYGAQHAYPKNAAAFLDCKFNQ